MNLETAQTRLRRKLEAVFSPILLEIKDESARHAGHAGARKGGETHFNVRIVSAVFKGMNQVARHRAVYAALGEDMKEGGIHALALQTLTPEEAA
ncbi:MAG: BolA family transcriptional regulator [Alphaproteobacteria bacterium]|nr:BolA family transcriptional regulator [Alphaproteobacteria bacterium]